MVEALAAETADGGPGVIVGTIWAEDGKLYNSIALLDGGRIEAVRHKVDLPNYGVFDEKRVFDQGPLPGPVSFRGVRIGVPICEDIWQEEVCECLQETGSEMLISPNGSPFDWPKPDLRMNVAVARVTETGLPLIYLNQVGGQDELVFDGASFVLNADHSLPVQMPAWEEAVTRRRDAAYARGLALPGRRARRHRGEGVLPPTTPACWACATTSTRTASPASCLASRAGSTPRLSPRIAVDALGPERVHCVMLPYRYTSNVSLADAADCAKALGVRYDIVPIAPAGRGLPRHRSRRCSRAAAPDVTEENVQSRARGTTLMAISNKFGGMVLTTGNKSEMSVGYATLYGDMNGGFNPIKDLYKMEVYRLARWRNAHVPKGGKGPAASSSPRAS